ncbi:Serine/Threonine protein kinase, FIKK family, putative [Plasmodium relictum]|uniref:Serine/Threonine protein kinase, FIKK family, putative n=1 Tax=Plasmodium relictum TaxID=85471 RepID=A0A1J1H0U9_PLARL|nr:Serine/Threonine protein kinase, FIKK family, putative [Plasmodium relictum]CRG98474.1 Serine/Threonine protein kinase, FIKK family, putative [Plasmodium relictum]
MIETTEQIDYSKSETLPCDDNYLSLKSEKTLNIDTDKCDIMLNEKKKKLNNENFPNKCNVSKNKLTSSNSIYNDKIKKSIELCSNVMSNQTFIRNDSQCNNKKSNKEKKVSRKSDISKKGNDKHIEEIEKDFFSNSSMYYKNAISTKYYDSFNDIDSKKSNNEFFYVNESKNNYSSKFFKNKIISGISNPTIEEKELFMKHTENKNKMNNILNNYTEVAISKCRISDINKSNTKNYDNNYSNNYVYNSEENSKPVHILDNKHKKIEMFLDYNSQNVISVVNDNDISCNDQNNYNNVSDNTKDCLRKSSSKLSCKKDNTIDLTGKCCYDYHKIDKDLDLEISNSMYLKNDKIEQYVNNKDEMCAKKEDFRSMLSQDIFNEMENINDSTTECNSMKDVPRLLLNYTTSQNKLDKNHYTKVPEIPSSLKEVNMKDKNSSLENICKQMSQKELKLENKNETFSNFDLDSLGNNIPSTNKNDFEINKNENNRHCFPSKSIYVENCANKYNAEFTNDLFEEELATNKKEENKDNYNLNKNSFKVGSDIPNEMYSKKKNFNFNKKTDSIKKKSDKTLMKSQFYEYTKNKNEESMNNLGKKKKKKFFDLISKKRIESTVISQNNSKDIEYLGEYFHNTIPNDIMKNIKYENPSNTYNEVMSNMNYDLTSELNNNNSMYVLQKNEEKIKTKNKDTKEFEYIQNEKVGAYRETHIHKNDDITRKTIICNELEANCVPGKRYLLSVKKNESVKDQKNQMLLISKQKIKKIWNKFKNNSSKEQNNATYDNKKHFSPNSELLSSQKLESNDYNGFKECINKPLSSINNMEKQIKSKCIFNWKLAQKSLIKMLHSAHNFYFNGVKYSDWILTSIPTLGFSKSSNRVQQMFKAIVPSKDSNSKNDAKLFIKRIPIYIWVKQFNLMNEYEGEYVTDGENFVMEAAALAFLNEYHQGITPKLYKILYEPESKHFNEYMAPKAMFNNLNLFNSILSERLKCNINGNIVIVSEFFSEDILDYIDRRQKKYNMKISNNEKSYILYQCLKLLIRLHDAGLSHLDLTPENILISDNYEMRLCDLSKSTPIYTYNLRHIKDTNRLNLFESCEPTIAKGAYMPPECWKIYWKYDTMKIKNPLKDLNSITDQEKRKQFYFDVSSADNFMLGVFFFWIWTNGNLWKCSDPLQDEDFFYFVKCDMDFDKFELTKKWPTELKNIIKQLLHIDYRKKLNLKDLSTHPWWSCKF